MRLAYNDLNFEIELLTTAPAVIVIENPHIYYHYLLNLYQQTNGKEGTFFLSDKGRALNFAKKAVFIMNPFSISCNDKKILNSVYAEMNRIVVDEYSEMLVDINAVVLSIIDFINMKLPYPLVSSLSLDFTGLLKLYNVKMSEEYEGLLDRLITYIKLSHQVRGIELFCFVNMRHYLDSDEVKQLYEACLCEQVYILDIEGSEPESRIGAEKVFIIDRDSCIIDLN